MPISAPERDGSLLTVTGLGAGYGAIRVLQQIDLSVQAGQVVALVGPNGAGKSTLLKAVSGMIPKTSGTVTFGGQDITRLTTQACGRLGLVHVIEGHRVLPSLTVEENLLLAALDQPASARRGRVEGAYRVFPEIGEKRALRAGTLSGGQQQMLAIGRALGRAGPSPDRSGVGGGLRLSRQRDRRAPGRAGGREGAAHRGPGVRPGAWADRAGYGRPLGPRARCPRTGVPRDRTRHHVMMRDV